MPEKLPGRGPSAYVTRGGELRLSNPGQLELLLGMKERGVPLRTTVRGFSMDPFIKDHDVLTIAPLDNRELCLGEVVAFAQPDTGRLAIHRVVANAGNGWLIRGDNCLKADGLASLEQIFGRVIRIERGGRSLRLGLGPEKIGIAVLNRSGGLMLARKLWQAPRRTAAFLLRTIQNLGLYRLIGKRFATSVVISEATESDIEAFQRRLNPSVVYYRQQSNPNVTSLVARQGGKIIGFAQLVYHPEEHFPWTGYWLFSLNVRDLYRGLGIDEHLTGRIIAVAREKGASELFILVYEDNKRAIKLNDKLGFLPVTLPAIEPLLEEEEEQSERRRIVMKKML